MLKRSLCVLVLLLAVVAIVACGVGPRSFVVPKDNFEACSGKMFDTAVGVGAAHGYHPVYENRRQGILKLSEGAGKKQSFIQIQFFKMDDGNFLVKTEYIGYGDLVMDGINSKFRDDIRNAMMKEAGVYPTPK